MKDLTREEQLFLGTQFQLMNWTLAQPGEDEAACLRRRKKVKSLIQKALQAFCVKTAFLMELRNRRDHTTSTKREDFKEAIDTLKEQGRAIWDLLKGLCARGDGEQAFLLDIKRDLIKTSEEGKQAARRGKPTSLRVPDPPASNLQEVSTAEGANEPVSPQPLKGMEGAPTSGRQPDEAGKPCLAGKGMNPVVRLPRLPADPMPGGKKPLEKSVVSTGYDAQDPSVQPRAAGSAGRSIGGDRCSVAGRGIGARKKYKSRS